ncbi:uncharacterized protein LOC124437361 [Xenia sp. Carnegie-2017]|uniref:uncharacterized protein LOC124437361 n=1 Tax=Xenia sp. Carnegie-2017 TaxID=2897299 RepID=UPI001F0447A7|nr:uncharacterized protein LOC124437361 [Xenia sp. Carnegie-2017]
MFGSDTKQPSYTGSTFDEKPLSKKNGNWSVGCEARNPFDGSLYEFQGPLDGKTVWEESGALFGNDFEAGEFMSSEDAAKLLDEDQKKFEESHQFDKQDAMIEDGISFTSYILPNDHGRRSLSVVGINDPDNKGEVRISFGDFFAAKTEELGRLGEDNGNKPRPRFNETQSLAVSPPVQRPKPLYRPSLPEGGNSVITPQNPDETREKTGTPDHSEEGTHDFMTVRSSPYGAEADVKKNEEEREHNVAVETSKTGKIFIENKKDENASSNVQKRTSKPRRRPSTNQNAHVSLSKTYGVELNNSALAALKFCNSSEGSKLAEMSTKDLKSLSKTLAMANVEDENEIYKVLVQFLQSKGASQNDVIQKKRQPLPDVSEMDSNDGSKNLTDKTRDSDGALAFYHSDTSCEISPTEPKFRSMSSMSSPPLDTSSPKSNDKSIEDNSEKHPPEMAVTISASDVGVHSISNSNTCVVSNTKESSTALPIPTKHSVPTTNSVSQVTVTLSSISSFQSRTVPPPSIVASSTPPLHMVNIHNLTPRMVVDAPLTTLTGSVTPLTFNQHGIPSTSYQQLANGYNNNQPLTCRTSNQPHHSNVSSTLQGSYPITIQGCPSQIKMPHPLDRNPPVEPRYLINPSISTYNQQLGYNYQHSQEFYGRSGRSVSTSSLPIAQMNQVPSAEMLQTQGKRLDHMNSHPALLGITNASVTTGDRNPTFIHNFLPTSYGMSIPLKI